MHVKLLVLPCTLGGLGAVDALLLQAAIVESNVMVATVAITPVSSKLGMVCALHVSVHVFWRLNS